MTDTLLEEFFICDNHILKITKLLIIEISLSKNDAIQYYLFFLLFFQVQWKYTYVFSIFKSVPLVCLVQWFWFGALYLMLCVPNDDIQTCNHLFYNRTTESKDRRRRSSSFRTLRRRLTLYFSSCLYLIPCQLRVYICIVKNIFWL